MFYQTVSQPACPLPSPHRFTISIFPRPLYRDSKPTLILRRLLRNPTDLCRNQMDHELLRPHPHHRHHPRLLTHQTALNFPSRQTACPSRRKVDHEFTGCQSISSTRQRRRHVHGSLSELDLTQEDGIGIRLAQQDRGQCILSHAII